MTQKINIDELSEEELRSFLVECKNIDEVMEKLFGTSNDRRHVFIEEEAMEGDIVDEYDHYGKQYWRNLYPMVADEIFRFSPHNKAILDVGCGTGKLLIALVNKKLKIPLYGIDNSYGMIQVAKKNTECYPNIRLQQLSVYDLAQFQDQVDLIVMRNTLIRLYEPENGLSAIIKLLPVGGRFYLREIMRDGDWNTYKQRFQERHPLNTHKWIRSICSSFTKDEIHRMLEKLPVKFHYLEKSEHLDQIDPAIKLAQSIDAVFSMEKI